MKKETLQVSHYYTLEWDENSPEFKEAYESYTECIDRGASQKDMIKHVAFYINRFGEDSLIEGVGKVWVKRNPKPEDWSGIMLSDYDSDPEVEFY